MSTRQTLLAAMCVFTLGVLSACGGPKNFHNDNDTLRRRVMELESQVQSLESRAAGAEQQLEIEKSRPAGTSSALPQGLHAPAVTRVAIAGASRGVDENKDGRDEAVRLYVQTFDRRDRFLVTIGEAEVTLAVVEAGKDAVTVALVKIGAADFDKAYRNGLGGTHYTLVVPLTGPVPPGVETLTVTVKITDLLTGASLEARKIVNIANPKPVQ